VQTGPSAGRQLMLEQTDEYLRRNPYGYRWIKYWGNWIRAQ
jgi:hypothetical protein